MSGISKDKKPKVNDDNSSDNEIEKINVGSIIETPPDKYKWELTIDFIMIVGKYLESNNDFINLMKICKKYEELVSMYKFNPIQDMSLFENVQTQHFYKSNELNLKRPGMYRYVYWKHPNDVVRNKKSNEIIKDSVINEICDCVNELEIWSGEHFKCFLFDSSKRQETELYNAIDGKDKLYFIIVDSEDNIFGCYNPVNHFSKCVLSKRIFAFSLRTNGRVNSIKYDREENDDQTTFTKINSKNSLFCLGTGNIDNFVETPEILISDLSPNCNDNFISKDISKVFKKCDKFSFTGRNSSVDKNGNVTFTVKRLVVLQMYKALPDTLEPIFNMSGTIPEEREIYTRKLERSLNFEITVPPESFPTVKLYMVDGDDIIFMNDYVNEYWKKVRIEYPEEFEYTILKIFSQILDMEIILHDQFNTWFKYAMIEYFALDLNYDEPFVKLIEYERYDYFDCRRPDLTNEDDIDSFPNAAIKAIRYNNFNYIFNQKPDKPFSSVDLGIILYGFITGDSESNYDLLPFGRRGSNKKLKFENACKDYWEVFPNLCMLFQFLVENEFTYEEFISHPMIQDILTLE